MAGQMRKHDIGTTMRVTLREKGVVFDASTAQVKMMTLKKPSGKVLTVPVAFATDGKDGIVTYKTAKNDLDESGPWTGQVFLGFTPDEEEWSSEPWNFTVGDNLSAAPPAPAPTPTPTAR